MLYLNKLFLVATLLILIFIGCIGPPEPPSTPNIPVGETYGFVDSTYRFRISATDPNEEMIAYKIDLGDGNESSWSSYFPSGYPIYLYLSYSSGGTYSFRAKAKNESGFESEWSSAHSIFVISWSFFSTGGDVHSSPAVGSDGTIYVGSDDDNLYAINPDGTEKWRFMIGDDITSSPAIASNGTIYVGSFDNNLYAVNPDGTEKWRFMTGDGVPSSPAIG